MKLEANKFYKTRDGLKIGPMLAYNNEGTLFESKGIIWHSDGCLYNIKRPCHDLVSEWTEKDDHIEHTKHMIEVMQAYVDGKEIEFTETGSKWDNTKEPVWLWGAFKYRIAEPKIQDSMNWDHVAPEYICHARNKDGSVFLCSNKPEKESETWSNIGMHINAYAFTSFKRGTVDWKDSLVMRPGVKG